ncbi:MAG: tryptophan--tRNA ligase [Candidatus Omnitrophica bacterium]|nr:tryptophan--tRNA ligase [Candidatus Omnitrophota bacterium]
MKKRLLSGMRPTGPLHLGHLVGALKNWEKLQDEYECFFMVADWHAHMSEYERPQDLRRYTLDNVIDWLSCGLDPEKSVLFVQSHIQEHAQLYLLFSNITPLGWLERCPTYKEQLREITTRDLHTYGFLGYPVLQAADIVIYKAHAVPVGADQLAHLELTREILRRFEHIYKKKVFPEPQAILTETPKLLGIDNRKMSKSYQNFIALSDSKEEVGKKTGQMVTDPKRIKKTDPGHPKVCNVFSYYKIFKPEMEKEVHHWCTKAEIGCIECKKKLADILNGVLEPIREKRAQFTRHRSTVDDILTQGAEKARGVCVETLKETRKLIGLY